MKWAWVFLMLVGTAGAENADYQPFTGRGKTFTGEEYVKAKPSRRVAERTEVKEVDGKIEIIYESGKYSTVQTLSRETAKKLWDELSSRLSYEIYRDLHLDDVIFSSMCVHDVNNFDRIYKYAKPAKR